MNTHEQNYGCRNKEIYKLGTDRNMYINTYWQSLIAQEYKSCMGGQNTVAH